MCSDVLYIALRDGLAPQLSRTLRALAARAPVFFAFEERLIAEETAFMLALREAPPDGGDGTGGGGGGAGGGAVDVGAISVEELPASAMRLEKSEALEREDGGEACSDLFWEPPPLRAFILRATAGFGLT